MVTRRLVLASRSPRRIHLLRQIGLNPEVIPCDIAEDFNPRLSPAENASALALEKAATVARSLAEALVIGADTIVAIDGTMLAKPIDRDDAIRMLQTLSGRTHTVVTGFAIVDRPSNRSTSGAEETRVTFRVMTAAEISDYVDGGSPMDKAGAYGIQDDFGAVFVSRIDGCFYNVVGLPLSRLYSTLLEFQSQMQKR